MDILGIINEHHYTLGRYLSTAQTLRTDYEAALKRLDNRLYGDDWDFQDGMEAYQEFAAAWDEAMATFDTTVEVHGARLPK